MKKSMQKVSPRTQQERVYTRRREAILNGHVVPGRSVTLRGVAASLDVSPMPVREALRRLTAERALAGIGTTAHQTLQGMRVREKDADLKLRLSQAIHELERQGSTTRKDHGQAG